ncbi:MAG: hypothetical protein LCH80_04870 [Proteobacteria bacterium]|nr:hypothetical protein [Pseudomonadota bacterium]
MNLGASRVPVTRTRTSTFSIAWILPTNSLRRAISRFCAGWTTTVGASEGDCARDGVTGKANAAHAARDEAMITLKARLISPFLYPDREPSEKALQRSLVKIGMKRSGAISAAVARHGIAMLSSAERRI